MFEHGDQCEKYGDHNQCQWDVNINRYWTNGKI